MSEEALQLQFNAGNVIKILDRVRKSKLPVIAVQLDLENDLSLIEDAPYPSKCLFDRWVLRNREGANWERLSSVLCHPEIGEDVLAREIEDRYMRRGSLTSSISSDRSSPAPLSPPAALHAVRDLRVKEKVVNKMRRKTEKDLMESFAQLIELFTRKLSQQEQDTKSFRVYLTTFFKQQSLPVTIPDTNDISTIIESISTQRLWGYNNYEDVECIAGRRLSKDKEVQSAIEEHIDMVNNYTTTIHIADYIEEKLLSELKDLRVSFKGRRASRNYYETLSLKLEGVSVRMKTLKYVRDLWKNLKREFHLPDCNALLDNIYYHCIVIVLLIPSPVSAEVKKPQPWTAIHFLQQEFICRMVLNESCCIYDKEDSINLLRRSSEGNYDEVVTLLQNEQKGAAVNATFTDVYDGKSSLILASEAGHELVMFNLLDREAEVDFKLEESGRSALFFAAEEGQDVAVSILLAYGADPHLTDVNGETAYSVAKKKLGNESVCKELEQIESKRRVAVKSISTSQMISERLEGARVTAFRPFYRAYQQLTSDLVGAARNDNMDVVKYILQHHKSDVNSRESDKHGWTPLLWATENGDWEMVDLLLKKAANPNLATKDSKWTPLLLASRKGYFKIAKTLLDKHADPNAQTIEGVSSLAVAAYEKHTAVALLLIHRGADIHLPANNGWTPLIRASNEGDLKLMKVISDLGAYLNDQTEEGWTALIVASHYGHINVVNELAKRGAELDLKTDAGDTALHIASLQDHAIVTKALADHGANLDITNVDGLTSLMVAVNKGHMSVVDTLLDSGADVNHVHKDTGWTASFFAAKNERVEILKHLLLHGATTELPDGTSLIDVASELKQMQIIDALGTSVDEMKVPLGKDARYRDVANSLDELVRSFGERVRGLVKNYI